MDSGFSQNELATSCSAATAGSSTGLTSELFVTRLGASVIQPESSFGHFGKEETMAKRTIRPTKKGQKPITFQEGGLHRSTGTPAGEKIPTKKMAAAESGALGPKAEKQALFKKNVLVGRKGK